MIAGDIAQALGKALCQRIGDKRYEIWFTGQTKLSWHDDHVRVGVPNHFFQSWLEKTFGPDIGAVAETVFGAGTAVKFVIDPELFRKARQKQAKAQHGKSQEPMPLFDESAETAVAASESCVADAPASLTPARAPAAEPPPRPKDGPRALVRPRRWRRLDGFVVGPCNRVAHAAARSLVETPDDFHGPLVLHGPVGIGKTHLLEGIYVGLRQARPQWRVCFITAEEFTNRFVQAMHQGKIATFRKFVRDCDALLLDDLHFLASKARTQEEFLHTLDALCTDDRPVVATCDCHPRLADQFMPELTDRLQGGALWGLALPDNATRLDILRQKTLTPEREPMPAAVLEFIAEQLRGNVRELEGALQSVWHYARAHEQPIDLELARAALSDVLRHSVRRVQLDDVEQAVCATLGLEKQALQSKKRGWTTSHPRMLAIYLARKHTGATYAEIGHRWGGRNHSTAVAGEKKVRQWLKDNASYPSGQRPLPVRDLLERMEREILK